MNILTGLQVETTDTRATMVSQIPFSHPRALKPLTTKGTFNTEESWCYTQAQGNQEKNTEKHCMWPISLQSLPTQHSIIIIIIIIKRSEIIIIIKRSEIMMFTLRTH